MEHHYMYTADGIPILYCAECLKQRQTKQALMATTVYNGMALCAAHISTLMPND